MAESTHDSLAPPEQGQHLTADPGDKAPRSSTPLGPNPMSPSKRPPTPLPETSSVDRPESSLAAGEAAAVTSTSPEPRPQSVAQLEQPDTNIDVPDVAVTAPSQETALDTDPGSLPSTDAPQPDQATTSAHQASPPSPEPTSSTNHDSEPLEDRPALTTTSASSPPTTVQDHEAEQQPPTPHEQLVKPDWLTDELDESWREQSTSASHSQSLPHHAPNQSSLTTRDNEAQPTQTQTLHIPSTSQMRIPSSDRASRSASAGTFFDARESVGGASTLQSSRGPLSRSIPAGPGRGHRESLTDTELQPGPSTPSKRKASHMHSRQTSINRPSGGAITGEDESTSPSSAPQSPVSAPDDFESARGSFIESSLVQRQPPAGPVPSLSSGSIAAGTFIHKGDVSTLPPILRPAWQSPEKGKAGRRLGAIGGDMFTPLKLQTMFKTPTPPERPPVLKSPESSSAHDPPQEPTSSQNPSKHGDAELQQSPSVRTTIREDKTLNKASPNDAEPSQAQQSTSEPEAPILAAERKRSQPVEVPSTPFTFRSLRDPLNGLFPARPGSNPLLSQANTHGHFSHLAGRPASAAAAATSSLGVVSPLPALGANPSIPSTPHTPMRLFRFNYEDAETRAQLEMLVDRKSPMITGGGGGATASGAAERERKRLRLDVRPRKVVGGDLMHMQMLQPAPEQQRAPSSPLPDHLRPRPEDGRVPGVGLGLGLPTSRPPSGHHADTASARVTKPSAAAPVVDYVKEAPDFMDALQRMIRVGSDASTDSRVWTTEDDDSPNSPERDMRPAPGRDNATGEGVSFHQGASYASPVKSTKSPHRPARERRLDADSSIFASEMAPISRSPSHSPLRVSTRRLPPTSSLHYSQPDAFGPVYDQSIPPLSSTLKSRKPWGSRTEASLAEDESPRKLLRRFSAAAMAEDEIKDEIKEDGTLNRRWRRAAQGEAADSSSGRWSDESFARDEEIRKLEERLARRARARMQADESSIDVSEVAVRRGGGRERRKSIETPSAPKYITLHEPTLEAIDDRQGIVAIPTGSMGQGARISGGVAYADDSEDDDLDAEEGDNRSIQYQEAVTGAHEAGENRARPLRVQNGIILYDSERLLPAHNPNSGNEKLLRNVASEAQLRTRPSQWQEQERMSAHAYDYEGPRHPTTTLASHAAPNRIVSQRLTSDSNETRRGERTVSSNTLVDDRDRQSFNSRADDGMFRLHSTASNQGRPFIPPQGMSRTVSEASGWSSINSMGATITRKGSMLNISQIPDEEVENLGGGRLTYDKELNRWVKKKPSLGSFERQMSTNEPDDEPDWPSNARVGSAFGRRSTTRTPVEPTIPEASIETSQIVSASCLDHGEPAKPRTHRRSEKYSSPISSPALRATRLNPADASTGTEGRLSDSSDPFRDFESIGQSTMAAEQSGMEHEAGSESRKQAQFWPDSVLGGMTKQPGAQDIETKRAAEPVSDKPRQQDHIHQQQTSGQPVRRSPVLPTTPSVSAFGRPINTMPKSSSSLRNVVTYSPDTTMRSSVTGTGTVATVEHTGSQPQPDGLAQGGASAHPINEVYDGANAAAPRHPEPSGPASSLSNGYPTTPERLAAKGAPRPSVTPSHMRTDTTPRSILKGSPSQYGASLVPLAASRALSRSPRGEEGAGNRSISFAASPTTYKYQAGGDNLNAFNRGTVPQSGQGDDDLSQSYDQSWSDDEDADHTLEQGPLHGQHTPGPTQTQEGFDRANAISQALKQLVDLTLDPETARKLDTRLGTPSRRVAGTSQARASLPTRSPWSFHTLRRPRKIRHPQGDQLDTDEQMDAREDETYDELHGYPDMTLLTDASFNFAHDKVLEAITDVEPWEPGWDDLKAIDLSERRLDSCVRLKEFLPLLEQIKLDGNEISYLTGLPGTLRSLSIANNRLTHLASFGHLLNLETLDISNNQIESLTHFAALRRLHTLNADKNQLTSLDGIDRLSSLVNVSLSGNQLRSVHLEQTQWRDLESLNLSHNDLVSVRGLGAMQRLRSLNLDHNRLARVDLGTSMPKLRVLRVSGNTALTWLDVLPVRKLRTLYADYCALHSIENLDQLTRLNNLSMRQQVEASVAWPARQLRDVRRLFFSGNAFPDGIGSRALLAGAGEEAEDPDLTPRAHPLPSPSIRFLNLVYLELAACQLTSLPAELAELAPNLRALNLDHNLISTLPPLQGMHRLKRLSVVGCRIKKSKSIIKAVHGLRELQVIDTRTNPCTLGLYPPLLIPTLDLGVEIDPRYRGVGETEGGVAAVASRLPPVPNPAVVQPDQAAAERRRAQKQKQANLAAADMSHFNKRHAAVTDPAEDAERGVGTAPPSVTALFCAADQRFHGTLPRGFREKRTLHRGLLAMACPRLNWVDGLFVDEEEVLEADELVHSQRYEVRG